MTFGSVVQFNLLFFFLVFNLFFLVDFFFYA